MVIVLSSELKQLRFWSQEGTLTGECGVLSVRSILRGTELMKFRYALAASTLVLGVAVSAAAVRASTVTDTISFSDTGTYGVGGASWEGSAVASGSFDITFDPNQLYLTQSISGVISNLTYSVTDPRFSLSPLTLNSIISFAYDGAGTLTLYSDSTLGKALAKTPNITIGINGWAYGPGSGVWYSQNLFDDTLTTSGGVSFGVSEPPSWLMLLSGFVGLGFVACRGTKKNAAAIAAA
jgi:hypothetical protein